MKKYIAISALDGKDELYQLSKTKEKEFNKLFGEFNDKWSDHNKTLDWLRSNAKFVGYCTCLAYE